ncbi:MAG: UDP-N-acetylmuramoyl-L-alanyl-D-glutamate--2,6-diaminopimelate ligase [Patescibacteria group bacterium]|nr:UDP-N-acetylmuramoyl-L-alanyl-D-glutamate--2,6-diaminopimelate ligase [Patescibacteria group bacterium]
MKLDSVLNVGRKIIPKPIFRLFQPYYHLLLAITGNIKYGFPGKKMIIIGVTGTNGKSTTADLITAVLKNNGIKTGMTSSVAFEIAGKRIENNTSRTTLGRWKLQKLLRQMVDAGCTHAVIEVASEGIAWHRVWGIAFDVAIFTNLSPEHLNFHKTMENYRNAKGKLFSGLAKSKKKGFPKTIIVNSDDKEWKYFYDFAADKKYTYGLENGEIWATNMMFGDRTEFDIVENDQKYPVRANLPAKFNVYNMLAAYATGRAFRIEPEKIIGGLESVKLVKGRMEEITNKRGIKIFVDYAVTPESFELLFRELKRVTPGRLISVFGATGDRDKSKRPKLGEMAAKLTDEVIITDEESYSENPAVIVDAIAEGAFAVRKKGIEIILDRREAIKKAIEIATQGDTIVITGMGHEKFRNMGGNKKIPWDEPEVIKEILKELK